MIISVNSNDLHNGICYLFFEVQTEILNINYMSFQLQRVSNWNLKDHTAQTKQTSNIWSQAFHCKYWHVWHLIGFQTPPKVLSGNNFHCFFCGGGDSGQDWDRACAGPRLGSSGRSLGSRYVGQCTQGQDERWATDVRVGVSSWDDTNLMGENGGWGRYTAKCTSKYVDCITFGLAEMRGVGGWIILN